MVSDSFAIPPALQHKGFPCPSPPPGVCSNSCPSPVGDAIQPSLSSPSFPAFNLSEYQGLSQWVGSTVKNLPAYSGDIGSVPELGRSLEEETATNGNLLQYSCLENPMDGGYWQATVHTVPKSEQLQLSNFSHFPVFLPGKSHGQRSLAGYRVTKSQTQLRDWALTHVCVGRGSGRTPRQQCNWVQNLILGPPHNGG